MVMLFLTAFLFALNLFYGLRGLRRRDYSFWTFGNLLFAVFMAWDFASRL